MKITVEDVAVKAGVSKATVSRVMTKKSNVNPETRRIVEKALKELGYTPRSQAAKENENSVIKMVMVVVGDVTNQFYAGLIKGISDVIHASGNMVVLCNSEYNAAKEVEYIKYADSCNFLGVIMVTAMESQELINLLNVIRCPVVLVNRYLRSMDLDVVCIDNYRGGYMATSYLIENGHKNIAHIAGPKNSTASQDRLRGYADAMKDANLSISRNAIFYGDLKRKSAYEFGKSFLKLEEKFSAVFVANDIMAVGFIDALYEEGVRVPDAVSVICFDNSPVAVQGMVKLTTVCMDPYPMGKSAADMLLRKIQHSEVENKKLVFSPEMIVRESVKQYSE
jgi:DNA-binding LacI/PurR family transcriptional regulator